MSNNSNDIATILRERIDDLETTVREANVGSVIEIGDGIARILGLSEALAVSSWNSREERSASP